MPLPDKYADEPTVPLDPTLWNQYWEAKRHAAAWEEIATRYRRQIEERIGNAFAAEVNGVKVLTYRPGDTYATKRLREDYPELTQHYVRTAERKVEEFDIRLFAQAHSDIAEQYRVRSFREVKP